MFFRRSAAPDIAGCVFVLFAATLVFPALRAPFMRVSIQEQLLHLLAYGGLFFACLVVAVGLFLRRLPAFFGGLALSVLAVGAAIANWHMPETGQLPAGVLGVSSGVLLLLRYGEFVWANGQSQTNADQRPTDDEAHETVERRHADS